MPGLRDALENLGYHPAHFSKLVNDGVIPAVGCFREAIRAFKRPEFGIELYGREELDKLFSACDAILEIFGYLGVGPVQEHLKKLDIKFVLTKRSPESFARSYMATFGHFQKQTESSPANLPQHFGRWYYELSSVNTEMSYTMSSGLSSFDPGCEKALARYYTD